MEMDPPGYTRHPALEAALLVSDPADQAELLDNIDIRDLTDNEIAERNEALRSAVIASYEPLLQQARAGDNASFLTLKTLVYKHSFIEPSEDWNQLLCAHVAQPKLNEFVDIDEHPGYGALRQLAAEAATHRDVTMAKLALAYCDESNGVVRYVYLGEIGHLHKELLHVVQSFESNKEDHAQSRAVLTA